MDRIQDILREADKGRLIGAAWLQLMDLRVIEVRPMRLLESRREVIRLWCTALHGAEFCVYAEPYAKGNGPKLYDPIWWWGAGSGLVTTIAGSARLEIHLLRPLRPIERSARIKAQHCNI